MAPSKVNSTRDGAAVAVPAAKRAATKRAATERASGTTPTESGSASALIDAKIAELGDWRGAMLARLRALIREADPDAIEDVKWRGVPVWSHDGLICTGETYKTAVKLTFAQGASVPDPTGLFNASLEGNTRRAIDVHEGDEPDEQAFKALVRAAVAVNQSRKRR